jgi:predicted Zn-dependent protease
MSKHVSFARVRGPRRAACAAVLVALSSCVVNPVTGKNELSVMSPAQEASVGREEAAKVAQQIGLVKSPALVGYVERLGARLAVHSPRKDVKYNFYVADMEEPNAFALPGGYIYVSRGLLALTNSEDELAGVIGHEIGHVAARHSAQRQTRAMGVGLLTMLGAVAGAVVGGPETGQMIAQLGQTAGAGLIASYGRDQERQADEIGQRMAADDGYDPRGITSFLRTLGRETKLRSGGKERQPSFLDSHPATEERVQATAQRAQTLNQAGVQPVHATRAAFLQQIEGIQIGPDPDGGLFVEDNLFVHRGLDFAIQFPQGWQTVNQTSAVAGASPQGNALIVLEPAGGRGVNPREAARAFFQQNQLEAVDSGSLEVGGFDAFRAIAEVQSQQGPAVAEFTWIAHSTGLYRFTATSLADSYRSVAPRLRSTVRSFHRPSSSERALVRGKKLAIVRARGGETLRQLSARSNNVWSIDETALSNGLVADDRLEANFPVKIAVATD